MLLETATRAIDCLLEAAKEAPTEQVELTYEGDVDLPDVWQVMEQSLAYARRKATNLQIKMFAYLTISISSLTHAQRSWIVSNLDGMTVILSALPRSNDDSIEAELRQVVNQSVAPFFSNLTTNKFSLSVRLHISSDQIPTLSKTIQILCDQHRIRMVEIDPAFYLRTGGETPSSETINFVEEYRAGKRIASTHGCSLRLVGVQLGWMRNFCGVATGSLTVLPDAGVGQCCERKSLSPPEGSSVSVAILQEDITAYRSVLERRQQVQTERLSARPYCKSCFAKHTCAGPCSLTYLHQFQGSERCYIIKEVMKDQLLENIYAADGLVWRASSQPAGVNSAREVSASSPEPDECVRPHCLGEAAVTQTRESPGLFPVVLPPWDSWISRRGFLGACVKAALALALFEASTWAQIRQPSEKVRPTIPAFPKPKELAGTWVDPSLLSMVGITANQNDSVEEGYHLRWFTGERLDFPPEAFPSNLDQIADFVTASKPEALNFDTSSGKSGGKDSQKNDKDKKDGQNQSVPPAFFLYRRPHYPHYDHGFKLWDDKLMDEMVHSLTTSGKWDTGVRGVRLSLESRSPWKNPSAEKRYRLPDQFEWPIPSSSVPLPNWAAAISTQVLVVSFRHPNSTTHARPFHFLALEVSTSVFGITRNLVLEAYADGDPEPVRTINLSWEKQGQSTYAASVNFDQGHMDVLKLVGWNKHKFELKFSFMDEDTTIASSQHDPKPGEWILINSIPFITRFQTWEGAKENLLRHQIKNRYLDFSGQGIPGDSSGRLDVKYQPLFARLQQAFVRLHYGTLLNKPFLMQSGKTNLAELRYKPHFFLQFWSMDPIIATLLSQKYADVPGFHNPRPPTLGSVYDYMITSAWQKSPAQRLCYITQKVSLVTTPPMLAPKGLKGKQLEGLSQIEDQVLYRVGINWQPQIAESPLNHYGQYEAPFFDVRAGAAPSALSLLTHYVDPKATNEDDRVVDSPIHAPLSLPYPTTVEERTHFFTEKQLDAVDLQQTLQAQDSQAAITSAQIAAYRELTHTSMDQFFRIPEPETRFNEWLPAPPPRQTRTVYYDVRAIDLFGRTSPWHGPISVELKHEIPPPEPVGIRAIWKPNQERAGTLIVSWRLGSRQVASGAPVNHFNILWKDYDPKDVANPRQFSHWRDKILKPAIPYRVPTELVVEADLPLAGSSIVGRILNASASTEKVLAEGTSSQNLRLVWITTDQCLWGPPPFVDMPGRYNNADGLLDILKFTAGRRTYDVLALEGGETLRVGIPIAIAGSEAAEVKFMRSLGNDKQFTLTFETIKESVSWIQMLSRNSLPEIGNDPELPAVGIPNLEMVNRLSKRRALSLRVSVDVTGRKSWFTNSATLEFSHDGRQYRVPIIDSKINETRHVLTDLTLGQVILEGDVADSAENPTPIFPYAILKDIVSTGVNLSCTVRVPPVRRIISNRLATETSGTVAQLKRSLGGELAFVVANGEGQKEIVCDVLTRALVLPSDSQRLSFLIRQTQAAPAPPIGPGRDQRCYFYPIYREEIELTSVPDLQPGNTPRTVNIAVSAHPNPPDRGYNSEEERRNLVSIPVQIRIPPLRPVASQVAGPQLPHPNQPWVDPFLVDYTTLPKMLDNRKVVQYKVKLDNSQLMKSKPLSMPATGQLELYRTTEDALRVLVLHYIKSGLPSDIQSGLTTTELKDGPFAAFNAITDERRYQVLVTWLIRYWNHATHSMKAAFQPIGKITQASPHLVDELEGVASGNVFYAVRSVRTGGQPSGLQLLPFRVVIPDISAPPIPEMASRVDIESNPTLRWRAAAASQVTGYEIYKFSEQIGKENIAGQAPFRTIHSDGFGSDGNKHFAPLQVAVVEKPFRSVDETIKPWFPDVSVSRVVGVFLSDKFDPSKLPLTAQLGENHFSSASGSAYDPTRSEIQKVPISVNTNGKRPFLTIVYSFLRKAQATVSQVVSSGELMLPRIQSVLGVFLTHEFDRSILPLHKQHAQNLWLSDAIFTGHYLANLNIADGSNITMVFQDQRLGPSYLSNIPVLNGRVFLPFGPWWHSITGVFNAEEQNHPSNLLTVGVHLDQVNWKLLGLPVADGTSIRVDVLAEDLDWSSATKYCSVTIPRSAQGHRIVAVVRNPPAGADPLNAAWVTEANVLPAAFVRAGDQLLFPSELPAETSVGIIYERPSRDRSIAIDDDSIFQFQDNSPDASNYSYRIVSYRKEFTARGLERVLRSNPTNVLRRKEQL
jgi:radical SAM protein with 4Fe4S-binding SPASM domain